MNRREFLLVANLVSQKVTESFNHDENSTKRDYASLGTLEGIEGEVRCSI